MNEFAIDLPDPRDAEVEWIDYGLYGSHAAALAAAQHHFGADREGRISLVSEVPEDDGADGGASGHGGRRAP